VKMRAVRGFGVGIACLAVLSSNTSRAADAPSPATAAEVPQVSVAPHDGQVSVAPHDAKVLPQPAENAPVESARHSHGERDARDLTTGRAARVAGWVSLSIGAEAAAVAIATSVLLVHEKSVRDGECDADKVCSQRGLDTSGTIGSLAAVNAAAWIVGAAGIGAGAILLLTHRAETTARTRDRLIVAVSPTPTGVGVRLWSTF
jgi:hypothetical protein